MKSEEPSVFTVIQTTEKNLFENRNRIIILSTGKMDTPIPCTNIVIFLLSTLSWINYLNGLKKLHPVTKHP